MVKPAYGQPIDAPTFEATRTFFDSLMRVLHPFMPFVTEEIWQDLAPRKAGESIMVQRMPEAREIDEALLGRYDCRNIREPHGTQVRKTRGSPAPRDRRIPAYNAADVSRTVPQDVPR